MVVWVVGDFPERLGRREVNVDVFAMQVCLQRFFEGCRGENSVVADIAGWFSVRLVAGTVLE